MRASKSNFLTLWILFLLVMPFIMMPTAIAWTAGDEEAIFGHTFEEEYWTNDNIVIANDNGSASFTASYVHVEEFQSFLIAFNNANMSTGENLILPYQLFGMHFKTPENRDVFIGAIFAFLLVHNETYGANNLPDMGHDSAWYVVPFNDNTTFGVEPIVAPIPATKVSDGHYRFGMSYYNLTCRIVDANTPFWFWFTLLTPAMTILLSELTIEYDIVIHDDGTVQAESLYTIGQVHKMNYPYGNPVEPTDIIIDSMKLSAVHYLSIFTSQYRVTRASNGNTITPPTSTELMDENISIVVGASERAFDIGMGRHYSLINETTNPWDVVSDDETAINALLGARLSDLILVAWQLPLSAFIFAHMAYGLSERLRTVYSSVGDMAQGTLNGTAFVNSDWWYAVTFPEWNGLRVHQDPVYVAYTSLASGAITGDSGGIVVLLLIVGGIVAVIWLLRRRS
jgi:hypothetical protein